MGASVDAASVMSVNAHKKIERWEADHPDENIDGTKRWIVITEAAMEVGTALFFSLLIITLSFVPIFTLQEQEARLFSPLAFTKTYALASAEILSATLLRVLMGWLMRGQTTSDKANPVHNALSRATRPA